MFYDAFGLRFKSGVTLLHRYVGTCLIQTHRKGFQDLLEKDCDIYEWHAVHCSVFAFTSWKLSKCIFHRQRKHWPVKCSCGFISHLNRFWPFIRWALFSKIQLIVWFCFVLFGIHIAFFTNSQKRTILSRSFHWILWWVNVRWTLLLSLDIFSRDSKHSLVCTLSIIPNRNLLFSLN